MDTGEYHVQRIKKCKDYYEILQVSKDCNEVMLKKQYRLLALKLHPDKCQVPGATDAFKALRNAYSVLSDPIKRREYDLSSKNRNWNSYGSQGFDGANNGFFSQSFEANILAQYLFNLFFANGAYFNLFNANRDRADRQEEAGPQNFDIVRMIGYALNIFRIVRLILQAVGQPR